MLCKGPKLDCSFFFFLSFSFSFFNAQVTHASVFDQIGQCYLQPLCRYKWIASVHDFCPDYFIQTCLRIDAPFLINTECWLLLPTHLPDLWIHLATFNFIWMDSVVQKTLRYFYQGSHRIRPCETAAAWPADCAAANGESRGFHLLGCEQWLRHVRTPRGVSAGPAFLVSG